MNVAIHRSHNQSAIIVTSVLGESIAIIEYAMRSHKYQSNADFQTIRTELETYGNKAAMDVIRYMQSSRNQ